MLKKIKLGEDAILYMKDQLTLGGILSSRIQNIDFNVGSVYTYFPKNIVPLKNMDYSESIEFLHRKNITEESEILLGKEIFEFLKNNKTSIAIFETFWNRDDPIVIKRQLPFFTIQGRKYDFLVGDSKTQPIKDYLTDASGYPMIITVIKKPQKDFLIENKGEIDEHTINLIVENIEELIIGAFDGEGYVIWQKSK